MKFVYVLVSEETDFYLEQTLLSIHSLRMYHPNCHVALVTDKNTYLRIKSDGSIITSMLDEIITIELSENLSLHQKSRYLKTSLRLIIDGNFLFMDSDTVILENLDKLGNNIYDIAVALRQDSYNWNKNNIHRHMMQYNNARKVLENKNYNVQYYFNSGVIFCKDNNKTRDFYQLWHNLWKESSLKFGYHQDQIDLCRANSEKNNILGILDGRYNCQIIYPNISLNYLKECKIFHYFSTSSSYNYLRIKQPGYLKKIRSNGITRETEQMLKNIREEYLEGFEILEK